MTSDSHRWRTWLYVLGIAIGLVAGLFIFMAVSLRTHNVDERVRQWVIGQLKDHFRSDVQLDRLHVEVWPRMGIRGAGLSVRYHNRTDLPPMFHLEKFSFNLGFLGIFRVPRHIASAYIENMTITIPPKSEQESTPSDRAKEANVISLLIVDQIVCHDTNLVIIPKKEGKPPLDFVIHDLVLQSVGLDKAFDFRGHLTNAKPKGEITTSGKFGPWDVDEPGETPLSGSYKFSDADLGPFPGIAGILSSTGSYRGELNEIEVEGETDTPDFSLDSVGKAVPLHTEFSATVNGTDGDTYLHPVRATLLHSPIVATGSIVRVPTEEGHIVTLDVTSDKGRLEDMLRLATKSAQPFMTGALNLNTKFLLPPENAKVLDKLKLDGTFAVTDGQWTSTEVRDKLASFSRHAEGQPSNESAGSSVSGLRGHFRLDQGVLTFKDLSFSVPGAVVQLHGTYTLRGEELDFTGEVRLQAKLSQMVAGKKSVFLKAVDPLFAKNGAGTLVPVTISGTSDNPTIGVRIFHKTVKKSLGEDKNRPDDKSSKE